MQYYLLQHLKEKQLYMKKSILAAFALTLGLSVEAQVPKSIMGKKFYNTNRWNMNPRFGGVPTVAFTAANKATIKKGDVVENATVKKYKTGFIVTTTYTKVSDTFQFKQFPSTTAKSVEAEMTDQYNQVWSTRFSPYIESKTLESFPEPKEGFKRNVIHLPQKDGEDKLRVELYAGIYEQTDCNSYMLLGTIDSKNLEGYGYTYYNVTTQERTVGTMKGCPDQSKKTTFVTMQPLIVPYNSKLPLVIYAPENVQIRYKVYSSSSDWEYARPQ
jgi:ecotin